MSRFNKTILAISLIVACLLAKACTDSSFNQDLKVPAQVLSINDGIDQVVISSMLAREIPGLALGVVQHDSLIHLKGYGQKRIDQDNGVDENTVFHTASISKLFTALAIMSLVEEGSLSLESQLGNLLPDLTYESNRQKQITVKSLLNHTSGLPDISNYNWERNNQDKASLKKYLHNLELTGDAPETSFKYSNLAYELLGLIVETVTEQSFEDYVLNTVLIPSGMTKSDFRHFLILNETLAFPHTKNWLTRQVALRKTYPYTREHAPSSTLNASAKDLATWMIYFLEGLKNGKPSHFAEMISPSTDLSDQIGLGFQIFQLHELKVVGHFGGDQGFRSCLLMFPEADLGIVVLGNCDYEEDFRNEIISQISALVLEQVDKVKISTE